MARKKAKFHIEVEYEDNAGELSTENMKIITCESEGDFKGITLAMTTGLAFGNEKGSNDVELFQKKLRLLRGTGSALQNCLLILHEDGALSNEDLDTTLMDVMGTEIKRCIDLISFGIAKVLGINNKQVDKFNEEYTEESLNKKDNGESKQQGLESDDFEDFL